MSEASITQVQSEGGSLPCLNSNISIEITINPPPALSTQHRKTAYLLQESVSFLSAKYGIPCLGFLTLTFADHVTDPKQAQSRLNSLLSNVIKQRYRDYLGVMERLKSGRIHYHLLVVLDQDIRTGVDFAAFAQGNYASAPRALRDECAFWRRTAKAYRFGRTELLPVRSNVQAMARYVGKYIAKHVDSRLPEDKGARLVRYSRGARVGTTRFMFRSDGSAEWRRKVAVFAAILSEKTGKEITCLADISAVAGKRWAYHYRDFIASL